MKRVVGFSCILFLALYLVSCQKEIERPTPYFDVTVAAETYAVGEEVIFDFTGDADLISFYSGEVLRDFAFKEGRTVEAGVLTLSFASNVQYGTQADQLSVLVSTDFNGNYSFEGGIDAAHWTDITGRFVLATTTAFSNSGTADISDLMVGEKPLYIAFRYTIRDQTVHGVGRTWRVQNLLLESENAVGRVVLGTNSTSGFQIVDRKPDIAPSRGGITASQIRQVAHALTTENERVETENWAISRAFEAGRMQDLGPDRPIPIKGGIDAKMGAFSHIYSQPGAYRAVFVAANTNIYSAKEVVRSVDIEIVD